VKNEEYSFFEDSEALATDNRLWQPTPGNFCLSAVLMETVFVPGSES
jgi:hypothetical protein